MPPEEYPPIQYGLSKQVENPNPVNIVFHEWQNIFRDLRQDIPLKAKLLYLFGPPGWSHDGSRKTSNQMRNEEKVARNRTTS
jgi:hypothetical protein